ncbi:MAG: DUF5694 domain-containing protein [Longimicrobiales bacterium]|nr:DUF5694 domain-containing protein [Longimicrobiales bacterium]
MIRTALGASTIILAVAAASPLCAQSHGGERLPEVMVLGTYHFANPGLDVVQTEIADVLSPPKQREIGRIVEALARFRPTKIAVEVDPASGPRLDSLYQAYRSGRHELSRSESQQLGFRLAARFDHPRVHPADHGGEFPFNAMMEYAQTHDPDFVTFIEQELARITEQANRRQRELTVGQILRAMNDPEKIAEGHGIYMRFSEVGAGDTYVGADLLAEWYRRNIMIFANLQRLAEKGDRILVIFGAGHAPILRELITYDPDLVLIEAQAYLPAG